MKNIYTLSNQFLGLSISLTFQFAKLKLIFHLILTKTLLSEKSELDSLYEKKIISLFSKRLKATKKAHKQNIQDSKNLDFEFFQEMKKEFNHLKPQEINPRIPLYFFDFILNFFHPSETKDLMLKMIYGTIDFPKNDTENPLPFFPKIPFLLSLEGNLFFVTNPASLVIQIKIFKKSTQIKIPESSHFQEIHHKPVMNTFTPIQPMKWKFKTTVPIFSHKFDQNSVYCLEVILSTIVRKDEEEMDSLTLSCYNRNYVLLPISDPLFISIQTK